MPTGAGSACHDTHTHTHTHTHTPYELTAASPRGTGTRECVPWHTCLALMVSASVVAGSRHHACTNQGTVKRLGSTAKGKNAKYTGVLSLTHTRELAVAPIGYPVAGTREFY